MKNDTIFLKKKTDFFYQLRLHKRALTAAVLVVFAAYLLSAAAAFWLPSLSLPTVLPLFFLLAGAVHAWLLKKNFRELTTAQQWLFSGALALTVFLLLASLPLWGLHLSFRNMLAGAASFLLPFVVVELWLVYEGLNYEGVVPWQATAEEGVDFPSIYLTGLPVRFHIKSIPGHPSPGVVSFLASGKMTLGEVFQDMVQKQGQKGLPTTPLRDEESTPYTWVFYTSDMLIWNRFLNPAKSLPANGVRRNAIIYARPIPNADVPYSITTEQTIVQ
jgi:hypothetical protein